MENLKSREEGGFFQRYKSNNRDEIKKVTREYNLECILDPDSRRAIELKYQLKQLRFFHPVN